MSLWWARKEQLDKEQLRLIERLPLRKNHLVLGPPGSGKTNVLLRRAQYARSQGMPNLQVLTFTRPLTEFVKTGCYDEQGREIFPRTCINTLESWIRGLYKEHGAPLPKVDGLDFAQQKSALSNGALSFKAGSKIPKFDGIFVDEAQDLTNPEVDLLKTWSDVLFFVGDDRQKIYSHSAGLPAVRAVAGLNEETLPFHYRLIGPLCEMADRIEVPVNGTSLAATSHYNGPKPGSITPNGPSSREQQLTKAADKIKRQLRAYSSLIDAGDRIGIVVPRTSDRKFVLEQLKADSDLTGKLKIIRARTGEASDRGYSPSFDINAPVVILTELGIKGLEFRAVHWLFCDENSFYRSVETYYTVVTRAKTSLDLYFSTDLPATLARAYAPPAAGW